MRPEAGRSLRCSLVAIAAGLLLALSLVAHADEGRERRAQERLDAIGSEIQAVSRRLESTREDRDDADRALREVETALADTHRRLDALQAERREVADDIDELERQRGVLEAERDAQLEALATQLEALYRLGHTPQLKLLLNQDDPARLDRLQTYLNHLSRARNERLDAIAALDEHLADNQASLDRRDAELAALGDELAARSADLAAQMQEREALVASLDARYASEQERLDGLDRDRDDAERVLQQVREEMARLSEPPPSTAIAETQGDLPWPVQGSVTSSFGRGDGISRNGMLIQASEGTPVTAVHSGRVVFADWMRGFGNLLIVDHGDQVMTLHAHLQHFSAEVGSAVSRGDVLGAVGNSGGQGRSALYFEVRRNGEPIDPQGWIAQR
ncbi:murein hydrolase activator EnvC family protein [Halomonas salipaludis]|uniref:Peptidase M23 n=1 Tax=Halomonas salipaludis TaxID=2032625 RepID=A0A2A2EY57_9GAMM|nr:peptidoglycan DD-metalloendopeptidase family protein [Halomonas salipaludis]PAU77404.1 peptidase M23 [Halomonas salipaludis]